MKLKKLQKIKKILQRSSDSYDTDTDTPKSVSHRIEMNLATQGKFVIKNLNKILLIISKFPIFLILGFILIGKKVLESKLGPNQRIRNVWANALAYRRNDVSRQKKIE